MAQGNPVIVTAEITLPERLWTKTRIGVLPAAVKVRIEYGEIATIIPLDCD
jgi:hypothetical protein